MQQFSLNTIAALLQNHAAGGVALCKMENAESCLINILCCFASVDYLWVKNKISHGLCELKHYALNVVESKNEILLTHWLFTVTSCQVQCCKLLSNTQQRDSAAIHGPTQIGRRRESCQNITIK